MGALSAGGDPISVQSSAPLTPQLPQPILLFMGPAAETPPKSRGRAIGVLYLSYFLVAVLGELLVPHRLVVVRGAINLAAFALYMTVTLLFYGLFKPVNRG